MRVFRLPDLGEGLTEAEIVAWHVAVGDEVAADQPLLAVETDKAVVEVPAPRGGRVARLHGEPGRLIRTGDPLVEFADGDDAPRADAGTVVGEVAVKGALIDETPGAAPRAPGGVRAAPAVRALAKRLEVDLAIVTPSGPDGLVTAADVRRVARILGEVGPLEVLRGARRTMARNMALAHAEVVPVSIHEDADVGAWPAAADVSVRLIRALVAGCRAEPALNAWFDGHAVGRRVLSKIDVGVAVDTAEGLFVPVLRDAANLSPAALRAALAALTAQVRTRTVAPEDLRGHTITLSNFGTFAGRYASPVVQPPTVAILAAGRIREAVVARDGAPAVRAILPLSLTFDHRAVTGGEAARFLAAVLADLERAS